MAKVTVSLDADLAIEVMLLAGASNPQDAVELVVRDYLARGRRTEARTGDAVVFSSAPIRIPFEAAWQDVHPAAVPTAVWADRPLGEVRRFDPQTSSEVLADDLEAVTRLWLVHQTMESTGDEGRDEMLRFPPVRDGFRVEAHLTFDGDVQVLLLVRR